MQTNITNFPKQRLSISKKGKAWREQHPMWAENVQYLNNGKIRKSLLNKKINFDLYGGKIHMQDLKLYLNPYNKVSSYTPNKLQHYPILNQPIDLLVGEEINRKGSISAVVANPEAISQLEEQKTKAARELIQQYLTQPSDPNQEKQEVQNLQKYLNYEYQDLREVQANWILNDSMKSVEFDRKLQEGLKHVTICSEEIYLFDIVSGEPVMELLNPKKVYTFRSGLSSRIEDADIIIINDYWSPGKIHDVFYDKFKKGDLDKLDCLTQNPTGTIDNTFIDDTRGYINMPNDDPTENVLDGYVGYASELGLPTGQYIDADGNVRVLRVYWRSQRKLLKVKSYNTETGEEEEEFYAETYKPNKALGEEVTTYWVNEWWQGTKIGNDIYIDIKPKELQYRRMSNPSICHPGIVGQVYNTNQMKAQSMVDKMKPLQYLFDTIMDRLIKIMANHIGKVPEVDLAKVAWDDIDKFLHFVRTENISFNNSFKESAKGQAAGHFNTVGGSNTLNFDQSDSMRLYVELLEYIRKSMYDMVGIPPQRLGEVSNRETVGGVERAVTQSSHITSELFAIHDNVKKRCAEVLLETSKYALKGNKKKVQYTTNEGITAILDIDGDDFAERDYGIYIENDLDTAGLRQKIEQLAHAWSQTEAVKPSTLLSIFTDKSMESIKRKLEADFEAKSQNEMEQFQQQQKQLEGQQQALQQLEERKFQMEQLKIQMDDLKNQRDNTTKLQLKQLELSNQEGTDNTLEIEKLQLQKDKLDKDIELKYNQLDETIRHNQISENISKISKNKVS